MFLVLQERGKVEEGEGKEQDCRSAIGWQLTRKLITVRQTVIVCPVWPQDHLTLTQERERSALTKLVHGLQVCSLTTWLLARDSFKSGQCNRGAERRRGHKQPDNGPISRFASWLHLKTRLVQARGNGCRRRWSPDPEPQLWMRTSVKFDASGLLLPFPHSSTTFNDPSFNNSLFTAI
ncbi:hypothetical protein L209DRAFT_757502 [Thermothelomyces heterothallicus CBS 203.75]